MTIMLTKGMALATVAFALVAAAPQDAPPVAAPDAAVTPPPVTPTIPAPVPTPRPTAAPSPRATPAPRPTPRATPAPRATPRADDAIERPAEVPRPRASVSPQASPARVTPPPTVSTVPLTNPDQGLIPPSSIASPAPLPSPAPITGLKEQPVPSIWLFVAIGGGLAAIVAAVMLWRRRRGRVDAERVEFARSTAADDGPGTGFWSPAVPADLPAPEPLPEPPPAMPPEPEPEPEPEAPQAASPAEAPRFLAPSVARAWLDIDLAPRRAGLNLITATADVTVTLVNTGEAAARDVRVDIRMVNAAEATDAALDALFDAAPGRPAVPPFALAPGETRAVRTVATMPRDAIRPLKMGEREIFVPVLAIDVRYADEGESGGEGGSGQTAAAWMIGITREGAEKLVPFRLDTARMHESTGARRHGPLRRV